MAIELSTRQLKILELVKKNSPITGEQIAETFGLSRPTLRSDLSLLVMLGYLNAKPKVGYYLGNSLQSDVLWAAKLKEMNVQEIMGAAHVISVTASVQDAIISLFTEDASSLIVMNSDGLLAGIVSQKDLLKISLGNSNSSSIPLSMVMTREPNVIIVSPQESILDAARKLIHHQINCLPVIRKRDQDQKGMPPEVIGQVTITSMTQVLIELASTQSMEARNNHE
ncbi:MAG: helix-turn-helix transcriptional regulator [Paenibacillaceae bacterium]